MGAERKVKVRAALTSWSVWEEPRPRGNARVKAWDCRVPTCIFHFHRTREEARVCRRKDRERRAAAEYFAEVE